LYTLPLLIGVIAALIMTRDSARGHLLNRFALLFSTAYLAWTVTAKFIVQHNVKQALQQQNISYQQIFTTPTPFNSLLWRSVVKTETGHYEGFYSVLDNDNAIRFHFYKSDEQLLNGIEDHWSVQRLKWFSKGFYAVALQQKDIIISDLRMGVEPNYAFRFKVGEIGNPHAKPTVPKKIDSSWELTFLKLVWQRIWDESVVFKSARFSAG
jgi:inner membrane protein